MRYQRFLLHISSTSGYLTYFISFFNLHFFYHCMAGAERSDLNRLKTKKKVGRNFVGMKFEFPRDVGFAR